MCAQPAKRQNADSFTLVYFGETTDFTKLIERELGHIINSIQSFSNTKKCVNHIRHANNENVSLIVSSSSIEKILPHVHRFSQLTSIYIIAASAESTLPELSKNYTKINGIFSETRCLAEHLIREVQATEAMTTSISVGGLGTDSNEDVNLLDPSFMYSQLLKEILLEFERDNEDEEEARRRFVQSSRELYASNARELNVINEFDRDYQNHTPVWWYTRECFLYKMLNAALRTHDMNILCKMAFFIRDLHRQLADLHSSASRDASLTLYRGQG